MNDQRSTTDQLRSLYALANRNGLYDAADVVRAWVEARERGTAERTGKPQPKPLAPTYPPELVRELLEAVDAALSWFVLFEETVEGRVLRDLRRAAQAIKESESKP